jgi:peptide-methionine (S)-S-oxide reductase
MGVEEKIQQLPIGYSKTMYEEKTYGITRKDFNKGRSIKVYAEELGGKNYISFNFYSTRTSESIKPCEMEIQKIIHFLMNHEPIID